MKMMILDFAFKDYPNQCRISTINIPLWLVFNSYSLAHSYCPPSLHIFSMSGGHRVSFAPSGDDNYRAYRWPTGWLPEEPQPDVHHQRQKAHELWRWESIRHERTSCGEARATLKLRKKTVISESHYCSGWFVVLCLELLKRERMWIFPNKNYRVWKCK